MKANLGPTRWLRVLIVAVWLLMVMSVNVAGAAGSRSIRDSSESTAAPAAPSAPPTTDYSGNRSLRGDVAAPAPALSAPAAAPISYEPSAPAPVPTGACRDGEEWAMLNLINNYRAANGLARLQMTQTLSNAAEFHSADMAIGNYFGHTLANGASWSDNMATFGYGYETYRAENISAGYWSASDTFQQWLNSPEHNANMLNPNVSAVGIGRASDNSSDFGTYWTTTFGGTIDGAAC